PSPPKAPATRGLSVGRDNPSNLPGTGTKGLIGSVTECVRTTLAGSACNRLHCRYAGKASSPLGADLAGLHVCGCRSCRGAALTAKPERGAGQRQLWWYSSSVTCSPRLASGRRPPGTASVVGRWVLEWPGGAGCRGR